MISVISHIVDRDFSCSRCGLKLGEFELTKRDFDRIKIGDRVGVISGLRYSKSSAYLIEKPEHDSNKLCEPRDSIP